MSLTGVILENNFKNTVLSEKLSSVQRQAEKMKKICTEVIFVTNTPHHYLPVLGSSIRIITEYYQRYHPFCGMHASFSLAKNERMWVVLTNSSLSSDIARILNEYDVSKNLDAVLPERDGEVQPFYGIYHCRCAEVLETLIKNEIYKAEFFLDSINWVKYHEGKPQTITYKKV
ncbi:molybdenum cofactor guanylyltransferase [Alteribacillus bidgolensis]|uniref:Molybdopterin-guanine dinucleotide biosynthesis protein A n=1 Tax=Alteribacillus bidgolensis TaxID=930129 RepID=A0A1G8CJY7_9BACI|nr:NTP transferase domain-containing protein [Alteribacillus bidgolensis]SDH45801.1 molybdopterin-guanine dinucleotide biosynthesis protein A [Alteribacillus bidgolensis]